ncbi:MAG: ABC transporter permease, partial [Propionibacteriaceae bacterium]|nr:ABC transporter permease [Propionibacteriaceae bacterium]
MLRYTLATMARSRSRLAAAGVAIVIATAFITVALLGNDVVSRTVINSLSVQYAQADLVVLRMNQSASWTEELPLAAEPAAQRPGVAVSLAPYRLWLDLTGPDRQESVLAAAWAPDPALTAVRLVAGQPPRSDRQIVLAQAAADRLGLSLGDAVEVCHQITPPLATEPEGRRVCADFQVSGLSSDDRSLTMPVSAHLSAATGADLAQDMGVEGAPWISLKLTAGADRATVAAAVESAVAAAVAQAVPSDPGSIFVLTPTEAAAQTLDRGLGDRRILTGLALAFAAVALLVAALVIANTFQVLIAQRTRQLALLRCVGADASQLARSVLLEAGLTGLVSSAVGVGLGCALGQTARALAPRFGLSADLPARIALAPATWAIPLLAGLAVTLAAGLAPARLATRVPPVAALRPLAPPKLTAASGKIRLGLSASFAGVGLAMLIGGLLINNSVDFDNAGSETALLAGSFLGVVG